MKKNVIFTMLILLTVLPIANAQEIQTVFKHGKSGGFGAITNKFTTINGKYANMAGFYGGWYVNSKFLIGIEGAAVTNDLPVFPEHSTVPGVDMSYAYAQFGLATEYVMWSDKIFHVGLHLFTGGGFTGQYKRSFDSDHDSDDFDLDENFFTVVEPGVFMEINLLKWMRFSPGVSYRAAFGSDAAGLNDNALSDLSYNLTLKFGKF